MRDENPTATSDFVVLNTHYDSKWLVSSKSFERAIFLSLFSFHWPPAAISRHKKITAGWRLLFDPWKINRQTCRAGASLPLYGEPRCVLPGGRWVNRPRKYDGAPGGALAFVYFSTECKASSELSVGMSLVWSVCFHSDSQTFLSKWEANIAIF